MTDEQNERAARVWREACGAYEDNSHDLTLSIRERTIAGDQAAAAIIAADRAELVERVKVLEEELRKANLPIWFYHPDHAEVCQWSPQEVVDEYYDPKPGDYVFEVECARPLPSVWCAVRVTSDEDADERFTLTEHPTEELARAALKDTSHDA